MITRMRLRRFKRFEDAEIELGSPVVFVGPNNAGKTTALQALALWHLGVRTWTAKMTSKNGARNAPWGVINRRDLVQLPVPNIAMLWKNQRVEAAGLIEIEVEGVAEGQAWTCAMEFGYVNEESLQCRPKGEGVLPPQVAGIDVAYLPPMSGLEANERRIDVGAIEVSLGQGKTADVLRNLCHQVWQREKDLPEQGEWGSLVKQMKRLFGAGLSEPEYIPARGEIAMSYTEGVAEGAGPSQLLDLSATGRGLQQTLLLLAFLRWRPKCVLLIDEPDAHLEILRQSQIYRELTSTAARLGSQLIVATHSEVVMNEAQDHTIVAFVGKPHPVRQAKELRKALALLGYEQFIQAQITGWVLYLEGSTDLTALRALAQKALPEALSALEKPFHHYVLNQADKARSHFFGLREAFPQLRGIAIFDNTPDVLVQANSPLREIKWKRRELKNYFCAPQLLTRWVEKSVQAQDLFGHAELKRRQAAMEESIRENTAPAALRDPANPFWHTTKISDDYLPVIFKGFFDRLKLPVSVNKSDYVTLAELLEPQEIDTEIVEVLRQIVATAAP